MSRTFATGGAPHVPSQSSVAGVMRQVLYALVPGMLVSTWYFGPGVLVQIMLAVAFAIALEWLMLKMRKQNVALFLGDYSAVVTAVLFALCIPPLAPWWVSFVGMLFAIVFAKHLYGGLGHNVFNPAMVGYVVVLIAFPQVMAVWPAPTGIGTEAPGLADVLLIVLTGTAPDPGGWDAVSQATPLDTLRSALTSGGSIADARQAPVFGALGGRGWEWAAIAYALGGAWLLRKRIIGWQVPLSMLVTVALVGALVHLDDPGRLAAPWLHLFTGGTVLAAFFIATDPVSGCASNRGRLIFGAGVGLLTLVIRRWGGYPDGVAFAVLLMNMAAPLIDRYTRPRTYGH